MKRTLISTCLTLVLAFGAAVPASMARVKTKHSAEHNAAIKTCTENYNAAMKEAKTKTGKERSAAMSAAKASRKQCNAAAPK